MTLATRQRWRTEDADGPLLTLATRAVQLRSIGRRYLYAHSKLAPV